MTPDFMLAGVASLIFVAVIIAALTASSEGIASERSETRESGTHNKQGPAKSNRHGDRR